MTKGNVLPFQPTPETLKLKISTSSGHQGRVANKVWTWRELITRLSETNRDSVTLEEYLAKPIAWQDKRKNQGYFVGGQFEGGQRTIRALDERSLLTFDVDNCSPALLAEITSGLGPIGDYEYFVYSTRKHTPAKPRVRIVMPVVKPVSKAQFGAVARVVASLIDPKMEAVDPVSFRPAQIMYWPSTCREAEFIAYHNKGILIDSDAVLVAFGDWTDYSKLPRSPREKDLRATADKVEDPKLKRGPVGAFCRTHDIHSAIQAYLPDVYLPGDEGTDGTERYSFAGGSTTNGAVVYDGGMQLYSYHSTDPCADRLVNPYDMVRIHLFGDLDKDGEEVDGDGVPIKVTSLPSYKAMVELCSEDAAVVSELRADNYDMEAIGDDFEAEDAEPTTFVEPEDVADVTSEASVLGLPDELPPPLENWQDELAVTEKGIIKSNLYNITLILEMDRRFRGALRFNSFTREPVMVKRIRSKSLGVTTPQVQDREGGDMLGGALNAAIRSILEAPNGEGKSGYGLKVSDRDLNDAITMVAGKHPFHPVQRYLKTCRWDGVERMERLLVDYFNVQDTPYHRAVATKFLIAAVMRVFEPGSKFDFVLILEGLTGIMKSTAVSILAGWRRFGELKVNLEDKAKLVEATQGKWILELPELTQFSRSDVEAEKAFLSSRSERVRLAWARGAQDYPRQFVLVGTTNKKEYLKDDSGNRRFWGVALPPQPIKVNELQRDVDLIWAEVYQNYLHMRRAIPELWKPLPLHMDTAELKAQAESGQSKRMVMDEDEMMLGQIQHFLDTPVRASEAVCGYRSSIDEDDISAEVTSTIRTQTCVKDIAHYVFGASDAYTDKRLANAIGRVMSKMEGWEKMDKVVRLKNSPLGVQRIYARIDPADDL